jgi:catechol 2,3-dioxygenase-like lactoylglutathione lyase family enzyme
MVETEGLTHINLPVADVHRAKAFYERPFGLQELFRDRSRLGLSEKRPARATPSHFSKTPTYFVEPAISTIRFPSGRPPPTGAGD